MKISIHFDSMDAFSAFMKGGNLPDDAADTTQTRVVDSGLPVRCENIMLAAGFKYIEDAQAQGWAFWLHQSNSGKKTADQIMGWRKADAGAAA